MQIRTREPPTPVCTIWRRVSDVKDMCELPHIAAVAQVPTHWREDALRANAKGTPAKSSPARHATCNAQPLASRLPPPRAGDIVEVVALHAAGLPLCVATTGQTHFRRTRPHFVENFSAGLGVCIESDLDIPMRTVQNLGPSSKRIVGNDSAVDTFPKRDVPFVLTKFATADQGVLSARLSSRGGELTRCGFTAAHCSTTAEHPAAQRPRTHSAWSRARSATFRPRKSL